MAKSILFGVAVVLATATLSIIAEVLIFFVSPSPGATAPPGTEVGIDLVTLAKERLYTPTGLITAAVIFTLTILLSTRRRTQ
jgi:hypothetical protein